MENLFTISIVRHAFGELGAQTMAVEALVNRASDLHMNGEPYLAEACAAKLLAGRLANSVTSKCIDLVGGIGFTEDILLAKLYRDCKIGTIYEGTDNIQLETIGKVPLHE